MPQISSPTPDATTTSKGKVQLAGVLGGTAAAPTLASNAIKLGSATNAADFSTTSTTAVQVTNLSVTATVPAGGRDVELNVSGRSLRNNTSGAYCVLTLWEGTVGSGTKLMEWVFQSAVAAQEIPLSLSHSYTPTSGSKTWNVGLLATSGTAVISSATGSVPIRFLVKNI